MSTAFQEIDETTLKQLTQRVEEAIEFNLALSPDDYQLLLNALLTLMQIQQHLANREITLHKLRKLLGIVCASEAFDKLFPKADSDDSSSDHKTES
jgi:transposase